MVYSQPPARPNTHFESLQQNGQSCINIQNPGRFQRPPKNKCAVEKGGDIYKVVFSLSLRLWFFALKRIKKRSNVRLIDHFSFLRKWSKKLDQVIPDPIQ